jgi:UDP-GlcNAc:undecaprenyl-phosphate GlcNAc-1-phosphate transferase
MPVILLAVSSILFFIVELLYFKIADHFNIIDKPNHRSSHTAITIRGGGIIFPFAILAFSFYEGFVYPYFLTGLLLIGCISFVDDIRELSSKVRMLFHITAVALLFYQLHLFVFPVYWIFIALIFVIGTINAINFMDGINGITGGYALVALASLTYINSAIIHFTTGGFLIISILAVLVFNFFNFRTKAKCFAGDVGSVSLAFIIIFFLLQLFIKTWNLGYLMLLLLYGLDAITTIIFRLIRKENILKAHRSHLYQYLANEKKLPHVLVASLYVLVQTLINIVWISFQPAGYLNLALAITLATITFIAIRFYLEGSDRLLGTAKS